MAQLSKRVYEIEVKSNLLPQLADDNFLNKQLLENCVEQLQRLEEHKTQMDAWMDRENSAQQQLEESKAEM